MEEEKGSQIVKKGNIKIKVSSEIVKHLSLGLYEDFARAVKELVSNSYDAGATELKIKLDLKNSKITLRDNGRGMNLEELKKKFFNIGEPTQITENTDDLGRKRIGNFGIGCISVFPYCRNILVITKKKDSDKIIEVLVESERFFKEGTFILSGSESMVPYNIYESDLPKEQGETIIILKGIVPQIIKELGKSESSGRTSIETFIGFEKFKWNLSQYIPIEFPLDIKGLREFFGEPQRKPMKVWLDGEELFRNVPKGIKILEKAEKQFGDIVLKYAIMSPLEPIRPEEARGLQLRLRDVAIGMPTDFNVVKLKGKTLGKLNWICGEIHILKGHIPLRIDRDNFSFTQDFAQIEEHFRNILRKWNDTLEKWAEQDKPVYMSLAGLQGADKVITELKKEGLIRIPKERLRIQEAPLLKKTGKETSSAAERLKKVFSQKGYTVITQKEKVNEKEPSIKVNTKSKTVKVYENHPSFLETINILGQELLVEYDRWNFQDTPLSPVCRLDKLNKKVVFNTSHPLFKGRLSDDIIKKLSLGIMIILEDNKANELMISQFNKMLEEILIGR